MKTIITLLLFAISFTSCTHQDEEPQQLSQTEIPDWLIGEYISENDSESLTVFQKQEWLIDLTFDGYEYWLSYYFTFAADYHYEPLLSFEAAETYIRYSVYNQYYKKELEFTVTKINETQITVDINDGVEVYNCGVFNKLQP